MKYIKPILILIAISLPLSIFILSTISTVSCYNHPDMLINLIESGVLSYKDKSGKWPTTLEDIVYREEEPDRELSVIQFRNSELPQLYEQIKFWKGEDGFLIVDLGEDAKFGGSGKSKDKFRILK